MPALLSRPDAQSQPQHAKKSMQSKNKRRVAPPAAMRATQAKGNPANAESSASNGAAPPKVMAWFMSTAYELGISNATPMPTATTAPPASSPAPNVPMAGEWALNLPMEPQANAVAPSHHRAASMMMMMEERRAMGAAGRPSKVSHSLGRHEHGRERYARGPRCMPVFQPMSREQRTQQRSRGARSATPRNA